MSSVKLKAAVEKQRREPPVRVQHLLPEDWDDVADLLSQFAQQCEIAFENHRPNAKRWLAKRLQAQAMTAQGKVANKGLIK